MDNRLTLIKDMVKPCQCAADIGTDHGFLICALVAEKIAKTGIAADINELPLAKAAAEISLQGLTDKVVTICTNGLHGIAEDKVDAVIIAGMGGDLIAKILDDWEGGKNSKKDFYLNPMTKPEKLRLYLFENQYSIVEERCAVAAGRVYSVIHAKYMAKKQDFQNADLYVGAIDAKFGEAEQKYCTVLLSKLEHKIKGIEDGTDKSQLEYWKLLYQDIKRRIE